MAEMRSNSLTNIPEIISVDRNPPERNCQEEENEPLTEEPEYFIQPQCNVCETIGENIPATMACENENQLLCNGCGTRHKAFETTKDHNILTLNEYLKKKTESKELNDGFICKICETQNLKVPGYGFCKNCPHPEILCLDCSKKHPASKVFRGHTINTDLSEFTRLQSQAARVCELCVTQNQKVPGYGFCKQCPEPEILCVECCKKHPASKMFRGHTINADLSEFPKPSPTSTIPFAPVCELCETQNQIVPGYGFCKQCPEPEILCVECSKKHPASKIFRGHTINTDLSKFPGLERQAAFVCELCETQNQIVPGYGFCNQCSEPEILCRECSKKHPASKMFRGHTINTDLSELPKSNPMSPSQAVPICEQCDLYPGSGFCNDCHVPEILCADCSEKHSTSKWFRGHTFNTDLSKFPKPNSISKDRDQILCEVCENQNQKVSGYGFCTDCTTQEILCLDCSKRHTASKLGHGHTISTNLSDIKQNISSAVFGSSSSVLSEGSSKHNPTKDDCYNDSNVFNLNTDSKEICSLCAETEEYNPASWFCKSCPVPELLCDSCAHHHKKEQYSRNHELCGDLSELQAHIEQNCILCSQCDHEDKTSIAVAYCLTCETKDPFCDECASKHTWLKEFSTHDICRDMQSIPVAEKILCEQCRFQGKEKKATCFCADCPDAEPICDNCAKYHVKIRKYHNHCIEYDLTKYERTDQEEFFCELCELDDKTINAVTKCIECDELMCDNCSEEHSKHTANTHSFSDLTDVFPSSFQKKEHSGTPYESRNIPVPSKSLGPKYSEPRSFFDSNLNENVNREHALPSVSKANNLERQGKSASSLSLQSYEDGPGLNTEKKMKPKNLTNDNQMQRLHSSLATSLNVLDKETDTTSMACGQPIMCSTRFDSIEIKWNAPTEGADYYIVSYKEKTSSTWKEHKKQWKTNSAIIDGLSSDVAYHFKVCNVKGKRAGKYSKISETIKTDQSPAAKLKRYSTMQKKGNPSVYKLPTKENKEVRNEKGRTRELIIGDPKNITTEKTLMLVGATGSGKSTLVDGIINYVLGVQFQDDFRFTMIELEEEEQKTQDQAQSQTEWVTVYKIIPEPLSRIAFTLNIIDTPGFGDTRGIKRDNMIIDQIRQLFSSNCQASVAFLDAVCFIAKAPDARLTAVQTYIFHQILSLFGKNMKDNFCNFITFADEQKPPVLSALKAAKLPAQVWFPFNNSGLFASNIGNVAKPSWDMGCRSFKDFFEGLGNFQAKSLTQTQEVLEKREHLQTILSNLQPQISAGLSQINELGEQISIYEKHKSDVKSNKNFTYDTEIVQQKQIDLPVGIHVTNCLICNVTCHDRCIFADDRDKMRCSAMSKNGSCRVCPKNCKWDQHRNARYKLVYETVIEVRTYDDMKKKYEEAHGKTLSHEKYLLELQNDIEKLFLKVKQMMNDMNDCKNELKKIALRPDPLSTVEHIDQMIQAEEIEKNPGYKNRIKMLLEYKNMAESETNVERISSQLDNVREKVQNVTSSEGSGVWGAIKSKFSEVLQR